MWLVYNYSSQRITIYLLILKRRYYILLLLLLLITTRFSSPVYKSENNINIVLESGLTVLSFYPSKDNNILYLDSISLWNVYVNYFLSNSSLNGIGFNMLLGNPPLSVLNHNLNSIQDPLK